MGFRDLSAWRLSIPSLETKYDSNQKSYSVYKIIVQRIDVSSLGNFQIEIIESKFFKGVL